MEFKDKTLLITGGTVSFGQKMLNYFINNTDIKEVRIFSRDEEKQDRLATVLYNLVESITIGASLLEPFMSETAQRIVKQFNCELRAIEELNEPRYMNVANIFATSDDQIKVMGAADIDVALDELGLKGSPTKVKKSMTKEVKGAGEMVKQDAKEAAAYVLGKLKEKHYI